MKQLLLLTALLTLLASMVFPQPGSIGLSSSSYRWWCCYGYDQAPGLLIIYVYHVYTGGSTGSQFMVSQDYAPTLTYLGETSPYQVVEGNSQTGISIHYGSCLEHAIKILEITYIGSGLSQTCSFLQVLPNPTTSSDWILVSDCSDPPNTLTATGGDMIINPDSYCSTCFCECEPDPVEQTSWGHIKALYLSN